MKIEFAFGKSGLSLDLPDGFRYRVLEAKSALPLSDPQAAIERALDSPAAGPPLARLAAGKKSAAISVCDITRPVPNRDILPPVLARLEATGIARDNIAVLIATGLHRPASDSEIREICGESVARNYRVLNHHARELSEHQYLGKTQSGTPVYIDSRFVSADLHISVGFIEPHLMLGFSGGRKLVAPGLAAAETISVLHSPKFMRDARATEGSIDENPLHHELLVIARMARHDFMIDVSLTQSRAQGSRSIAGVFAGEPVEAHRAGVEFVAHAMLETIEEPADAVITSAAGYPLDLTFYQAIKGITAASHVVKPGGEILLLAACEEGVGGREFAAMLKENPSDRDFMRKIADAPVVPDQWQLEKLALVTASNPVSFYVPGLPHDYHAPVWGKLYSDAVQAVESIAHSLPRNSRIALMPEGPYVLARAAMNGSTPRTGPDLTPRRGAAQPARSE
ncbi:MAG TPA: nickel-dependent lactate racemase [Terriglobia bacterium]|nr:nickel-dependent lactate racemase [Terriglobia bacterium]